MRTESQPPNPKIWGDIIRRLGIFFEDMAIPFRSERELRDSLKEHFEADSEKGGATRSVDVGIFDPKASGSPCVKRLLVVCTSTTFSNYALDIACIAEECRGKLKGVLFLPIKWDQQCEDRLEVYAPMLRKYGVLQICVKFPLSTSTRCFI